MSFRVMSNDAQGAPTPQSQMECATQILKAFLADYILPVLLLRNSDGEHMHAIK